MRFTFFLAPFAAATLIACAEFPELDSRISPDLANAPVPALLPLAPIVARANAEPRVTPLTAQDIASRIATLGARAARLRGPVIAAPIRARMLRGVR